MKKFTKILLLILVIAYCSPLMTWAAGSIRPSTSSLNITTGSSGSFSVNANNAVGRVDISSSNPAVASVSTSSFFLDNNGNTVTVTGRAAGSAVITITLVDAASYDEEILTGSYRINVTVSDPVAPPTPTPTPTPNPRPNNPTSPVTGKDNRSSNANLKQLSVEGFQINKVDDTHYNLSVRHSIDKIKIMAQVEDSKATVTGAGEVSLKVGKNPFEITVTAENGTVKKYVLEVTRRDNQYKLEQLKEALSDDGDVYIVIEDNDTITSNDLNTIKNSKKKIEFVRFNEEKEPIYTLVIDGNKLGDIKDIKTDARMGFDEKTKFDNLVGYRKGMYFQFTNQEGLPKGLSVRIPVTDEYSDKDKFNLYYYDAVKNKINLKKSGISIENGEIEFTLGDSSNYFLTPSKIELGNNSYKIAAIVEFVIIILLTGIIAYDKFGKKNN